MYVTAILCLLLGVLAIAAARRIPVAADRPYDGMNREEWLALARAGVIMVGAFLLVAGVILLVVALQS